MKRKWNVFGILLLVLSLLVMPVHAQSMGSAEGASAGAYFVVIAIAFVIALIVVSILRAGMKNVHLKQEAGNYVSRGLNLTLRRDQFTHKTTSRRKIETSSGTKVGR